MHMPLVWHEINTVVKYAVQVLAAEEPSLYLMPPHGSGLPYSINDPQALGTLLWNAALDSLASRYGQSAATDHETLFGPYEYVEPAHPPVSALAFLLHCANVECHSCASTAYYTTTAWQVLHALERRAIRLLPGWKALPWSADATNNFSTLI